VTAKQLTLSIFRGVSPGSSSFQNSCQEAAMESPSKIKVIFIAGTSFSGSTLLGLLLGSEQRAFYAGEVNHFLLINDYKNPQDPSYRTCTCGKDYSDCPLWSEIKSGFQSTLDFNPAPGVSILNLKLFLKLLNPFFVLERHSGMTEYGSLIHTVFNLADQHFKGIEYVVDSSKSVHSLYELTRSPEVDVYVLHIIREGVSVCGSFKKRGYTAWYGILVWLISNIFMSVFLKKAKLNIIRINYKRLCKKPYDEFMRINEFLGTELNVSKIVNKVRREQYHLLGGNTQVAKYAHKARLFDGITYSDDRKILSSLELYLVRSILAPFHRVFLGNFKDSPGV
jgi:hypothetical protein